MSMVVRDDWCTCGHDATQHIGTTGRCRARDEDGDCRCPRFDRDGD